MVCGINVTLWLDILGCTLTNSGEQRTDTDSCGTKVVDLVDFLYGIDLIALCQDITDLIGGNGIQSTAERV